MGHGREWSVYTPMKCALGALPGGASKRRRPRPWLRALPWIGVTGLLITLLLGSIDYTFAQMQPEVRDRVVPAAVQIAIHYALT